MVKYEVFSHCIKYRYKTSICSKATFLTFFITVLAIFIPFLIAYRTQGLWVKNSIYREQPDVHFKYEFLFILETDRIESPIICTTIPKLFNLLTESNNCPIVKVMEKDTNRDGLNDVLQFDLEALLPISGTVRGVVLLLIFDYKLYSYSWLEMETAGFLQAMTSLDVGKIDISAELKIYQRQALRNQGRDARYNASVIPNDNFNLALLMKTYAARNVSTKFENVYTIWTRGRGVGEPFKLSATVYYTEDSILYTPGFWQVIKLAWVQYFSLLVPSIFITRRVKQFILGNSLVHTIKEPPWKKML